MRLARLALAAQRLAWTLAVAGVVAGCASGPRNDATSRASMHPPSSPGTSSSDGPGANPPVDLASVPDAEPRVEPVRPGGANKPYQVLGREYVPSIADAPFSERGLASWYGRKFHGRKTASGEAYDMYAMTAAHPTLPIPSYARIRNPANGREVLVRINDRGPFHPGRIVDLSYAAAFKLDLLRGVAPVELQRLTFDEIRSGAWHGDGVEPARTAKAASGPEVAIVRTPPEPAVIAARDVALVAASSPGAAEPVATAPVAEAPRGFWLQLGAFRERDGAQSFQRRVGNDSDADWLAPLLATFNDRTFYRVQAGPYPSREEAESAALRVRSALGLVPMIVERR